MAAEFEVGGYDFIFADKNLERYTCSAICKRVLKDPYLTGCCGQHFCESCLDYWLENCAQSCPHCRAEGRAFQILYDKKLKREIDALRIYCTKKEEGCLWIGETQHLRKHLDPANAYGCDQVEVDCPNRCEGVTIFDPLKLKRKDLDNHLKNVCPLRPHKCEHCGIVDMYENITGGYHENFGVTTFSCHYNICPKFPLECPNKCGTKDIKRKDLQRHRRQCPEEKIECPNKCRPIESTSHDKPVIGSQTMVIRRKELTQHLSSCTHRKFKCEYCGKKGLHYVITTTHYRNCLEYPLLCPNWCGELKIKRKDVEDHLSQCPEEPVQCLFQEAGCKEKLVRRELEQHMSATQQQHLLMVMGAYKEMKKENDELKEDRKEMKKAYSKLENAFKETNQEICQLRTEFSLLQVKVKQEQTKDDHKAPKVKKPSQSTTSIFEWPTTYNEEVDLFKHSDDDELFRL